MFTIFFFFNVFGFLPFQSQWSLYWTTIQNFNFSLRRDHQKNFLWASCLWVGRRQEPIIDYSYHKKLWKTEHQQLDKSLIYIWINDAELFSMWNIAPVPWSGRGLPRGPWRWWCPCWATRSQRWWCGGSSPWSGPRTQTPPPPLLFFSSCILWGLWEK